MRIRKAELRDTEAIGVLWSEMMCLHEDLNHVFKLRENAVDIYTAYARSVIKDQTKLAVVAEENDKVVGYAFCEIIEQPPIYVEMRVGSITEICVDKDNRLRGIGKALVDKCKAWLKEAGSNRMDVTVASDNPAAQGFWRRMGLVPYVHTCWSKIR